MNAFTTLQKSETWIKPHNYCRACKRDNLELILDLGVQPLAGAFLHPDQLVIEEEQLYPLTIHVCQHCGLVQNTQVIPPERLYWQYHFSSKTIPSLVDHFKNYALWLKNRFSPGFVFEFGCNDGVLLSPLDHLGIRSCGVDISENICALARQERLNVIHGYFDQEIVDRVLHEYGAADIITGSNVFAHIDEPGEILNSSSRLLKSSGHLCLEVMYAGDLYESMQWDSMYHEHLSFYSLHTLKLLLYRYGFIIVDAQRIPMHAGSLRIVASMDSGERPNENVANLLSYENAIGLNHPDAWRSFSHAVRHKISIVSQVMQVLGNSHRIWGYGAAGRASMWLNACRMDYLEAMVDISPLRAGSLMPGIHTPIVYPDELRKNPPDYIFVTAWNYLDTIRAKENWFKGVWIVPNPDFRFLGPSLASI